MVGEVIEKPLPLFKGKKLLKFRDETSLNFLSEEGKILQEREHMRSWQPMSIMEVKEWNGQRKCYLLWVRFEESIYFPVYENEVKEIEGG